MMELELIGGNPYVGLFESQLQTSIEWRKSTAEDRIDRLKRIRSWINKNQKEIREALWNDFRKPEVETDLSEIFPVTSEINHTIKNLKSWMKAKSISTPLSMLGTNSKIKFEPKGRALIISPWNYPFNLAVGPLVSALAAGCPVILKPSELTPHTSSLIERMISEIFPNHEVATILGGVETSQELLKLPFDHIFFTGSTQVGKIVMGNAAKNLISVTLELGGKSPAIVTENADITDTAKKLIYGKLLNSGQTCVAPDYALVHESIYERFLDELIIAIREMYDPNYKGIIESPDLARIVNDRHFERLEGLLKDAISKGAKLEFGGECNPHHRYVEPTLISGISEEMNISQEEIFGPIFPIIVYSDLEKAIYYINKKPKPLALYVFSQNKGEVNQVLEETSSGNAVVNDCVLHFLHPNLPFGGVNHSGIGKSHGYFGFLAFSNEKGVLHQRVGLNNATLLRPPYGVKTRQIIKSLIKWL
ncbi:aldehyde dehydrogenase family protein [Algoriphagus zhangzhouensis]|uniref:Aldehyde dehydrogenase n=1 Tax=Algoriphagus zhangzhouensis TaxID=1073327 RepID=A0A1M7ZBM8_9BACT|nr:aldehyde dehydrogenase family protein [Algoriphagus zhangzhouensis]TDY46736.1 aldehyde dehydrogenase (NAD+) [Algoriphagus zhangzhouensis]SHO62305.1 aldehyde dehydrogenase (NAD+) [Algoriphagus zhangzhouensis]